MANDVPVFRIYKHGNKGFLWRLEAQETTIAAGTVPYATRSDCVNAIRDIKIKALNAEIETGITQAK